MRSLYQHYSSELPKLFVSVFRKTLREKQLLRTFFRRRFVCLLLQFPPGYALPNTTYPIPSTLLAAESKI